MLLTRQAARMAKGWDQATVQAAAKNAADELIDRVLPYARLLIAQHRAEGRPVVMATTTPVDLVTPLADLLELDDVNHQRTSGSPVGSRPPWPSPRTSLAVCSGGSPGRRRRAGRVGVDEAPGAGAVDHVAGRQQEQQVVGPLLGGHRRPSG